MQIQTIFESNPNLWYHTTLPVILAAQQKLHPLDQI